MTFLRMLLLLLVLPTMAWAELAVCFDVNRSLGSQFYSHNSIDPSKLTDPNCSVVTKASGQTPAQRTLIQTTPNKYLKVAGGLAVLMDAAEQTAVDDYLTTLAATNQQLKQETEQAGVCKFATLEEVSAALLARKTTKHGQLTTNRDTLQAAIDAVAAANLTALKAILTDMNTAKYTADRELLDEEYKLSENIMRCVFANARVR